MLKQAIIKQAQQPDQFEWVVFDRSTGAENCEPAVGHVEELEAQLGEGVEASVCYIASPLSVTVNEISLNEEQRKYATRMVPFLLEDQLVNDVAQLHFALNKQRDAVAVTDASQFADQLQAIQSDVLSVNQCIPALLVVPYQADTWSLHYDGQVCLIRLGEKSGVAVHENLLPLALERLLAENEKPASGIRAFIERDDLRKELEAKIPDSLAANMEIDVQPLLKLASRDTNPVPLNMMQGPFALTTRWLKLWGKWRIAVCAFAALLVVQTAMAYLEHAKLDGESLAMRQSIEQVYREVFPRGVVVNPEEQMRRQLQTLRKRNSSASFIAYYGQLGTVLNRYENIALSALNYEEKSAEIRLNLTVADYQTVEKLRSDLAAVGLKADLLNSNAQDDGVQARLRIKQGAGAQ